MLFLLWNGLCWANSPVKGVLLQGGREDFACFSQPTSLIACVRKTRCPQRCCPRSFCKWPRDLGSGHVGVVHGLLLHVDRQAPMSPAVTLHLHKGLRVHRSQALSGGFDSSFYPVLQLSQDCSCENLVAASAWSCLHICTNEHCPGPSICQCQTRRANVG